MTLILRKQREQERIEGRKPIIEWSDDDYAVVDGDTGIGTIYRTQLPAGFRWMRFLQVLGAPPPNSGNADTLDEAKATIAARYEAVRRPR